MTQQTCCAEKDAEIADLRADLVFTNARIRNYQDALFSMEEVIRTKDSRIDALERRLAQLGPRQTTAPVGSIGDKVWI